MCFFWYMEHKNAFNVQTKQKHKSIVVTQSTGNIPQV